MRVLIVSTIVVVICCTYAQHSCERHVHLSVRLVCTACSIESKLITVGSRGIQFSFLRPNFVPEITCKPCARALHKNPRCITAMVRRQLNCVQHPLLKDDISVAFRKALSTGPLELISFLYKLSSNFCNPAYNGVFNSKFKH